MCGKMQVMLLTLDAQILDILGLRMMKQPSVVTLFA